MKLSKGIFIISFLFVTCVSAQKKQAKPEPPKRYTQAEVLDSVDGIKMYNKLIAAINGDSVRYNKDGSRVQGWCEDFYVSGKTLHKGFYKEGKLDLFRNFYENGKNERTMATIDPTRANMDLYYDNGNQRRQINYYNGAPKKTSEFYLNGLLKSIVEYDIEKNQILMKKTWYESGQITGELAYDAKTKKYNKKTYHLNGKIFESGQVIYSPEQKQFFKSGTWTITDEEGKNKKIEKYSGFKSVSIE